MQRVPGRPLLQTNALRMAAVLADLQLRLHALDPTPLARAPPRARSPSVMAIFTRRTFSSSAAW
jgi:hypothetical protein